MTKTEEILKDFFIKNEIAHTEDELASFDALSRELRAFCEHTNLTAIKDEEGIAKKHFADSLTILKYGLIKENARMIDVGCGAGFPGLPIKLMRPDIDVTFLDSTEKKLRFTKQSLELRKLSGNILPMRAEEASRLPEYREKFDIAVSRAVASLPVLCELCLPFLRVGGIFVAYKAENVLISQGELESAKGAIAKLSSKLVATYDADCGDGTKHMLCVIRKEKPAAQTYPRRYAQILKKPL